MSTLLNLKMANSAAAADLSSGSNDYKTVVCIFLQGGMDSFNVLVPRDSTAPGSQYANYQASRTDLALPFDDLLPLDGTPHGLHPATAELQELYNGIGGDPSKRRLSFVSNLGTLIRPTTMEDYRAGRHLPQALFSHIDQIEQWQTSLPQSGTQLTGWAGRAADVLHSQLNQDLTSMSISFAGNNIFQVGQTTQQFVMTPGGALSYSDASSNPTHPGAIKNAALKSMMEQEYASLMEQSFADLTESSVEQQEFVQEQFSAVELPAGSPAFPPGRLGPQLEAAFKMINIRQQLGLRRQTIFVSFGGWDHHGELLNTQDGMLRVLSPAIGAFQAALEHAGLQDSVVTFTASDFGRTLRSNGRGSDHAWGGNQMVLGGPVDGGKILGTYPDLALDQGADVGRGGRLLPTTSIDEFYAEILKWFGIGNSSLNLVLPNYSNFNINPPLAMMK